MQPLPKPFPLSIIQPEEEEPRALAETALRPRQPSEVGEEEEHYLLEVFKFIARMMFLISTIAIN